MRAALSGRANVLKDNQCLKNYKCLGGQAIPIACCQWGFKNAIYNTASQCCDSSAGVKDIGTC